LKGSLHAKLVIISVLARPSFFKTQLTIFLLDDNLMNSSFLMLQIAGLKTNWDAKIFCACIQEGCCCAAELYQIATFQIIERNVCLAQRQFFDCSAQKRVHQHVLLLVSPCQKDFTIA